MSAVLACARLGVRAAVGADGSGGRTKVIVTALSWGLASTDMGCSVANSSCPFTSTRPRTAYRRPGLICASENCIEKLTADRPGTARLSVLITFADPPMPADSSSVASKIEFAGSTVRSTNLAVPLRLLFLAVVALVTPGVPNEDSLFAQPASAIKSIQPSSVHDAARHALWVARLFHVVLAKRLVMLLFNWEIEKSCLKKAFRWAAFACGPIARQMRWRAGEKAGLSIKSAHSPIETCVRSY